MSYALRHGSNWVEIVGAFTVGTGQDAFQYPTGWLNAASAAERAEIGAVRISEPAPIAPWLREIGRSIVDVAGVPTRRIETAEISNDELAARVNAGAGEFRRRYITDITGQQASYLQKETEARAFVATGQLLPGGYVDLEARATGRSPTIVAATIIGLADAWRPLDCKIEGARQGALAVIGSSSATAEQKWTAAQVDWDALAA